MTLKYNYTNSDAHSIIFMLSTLAAEGYLVTIGATPLKGSGYDQAESYHVAVKKPGAKCRVVGNAHCLEDALQIAYGKTADTEDLNE